MHFGFASRLWLPGILLLSFGRLWGWTLQWAVRGLEPLPQLHRGLPHPPPPPAPHPLHPARRTRTACSASAGAGGAGGGGTGRGRPRCPGSQPPAAENEWVGASRWRTGFGPRASGCPQPPSVTRPTQLGTLLRLRSPPSSRGARRGRELGRKEPGKGGVGGRKAKAGGRRGRKRPPCGRAGPRGVAARVAGPCNLDPPLLVRC